MKSHNSKPTIGMRKQESSSSEDFGKQEFEEGKTGQVADFLIRSPNIMKKQMNFGKGATAEFVWVLNQKGEKDAQKQKVQQENHRKPQIVDEMRKKEVKISKCKFKWERNIVLDSIIITCIIIQKRGEFSNGM